MAANVRDNLLAFGCQVDFMTGSEYSVKQRYIDVRSEQQILRIDTDHFSDRFDASAIICQYDAVVISDYDKGFMTYGTIRAIREKFSGPIFIDTKKIGLAEFEGCFVKINNSEFEKVASVCSEMIVTLGDGGARYNDKIYETDKVNIVDICGAGDTFLAALAYGYLCFDSIEMAIPFANKCSAISVQHRGVYALTPFDINSILSYDRK